MTINTIPFGYDAGAVDRIQEHVDRIDEQHSKEMFSKKQLLDLLDEIDKQIFDFYQDGNGWYGGDEYQIKTDTNDRVRQRLLTNEV